MNRIPLLWVLLFSFVTRDLSAISADDLCPICNKKYGPKIYALSKHGRDERVLVCGDCAKLDTTCYICGIPVKEKFMRLADGRLLCDEDAKQAVLTQEDANNIFEEVKADAQSLLARLGSLPDRNIHLALEAKARLDKTGNNIISAHDDRLLMGLTRTTASDAEHFEHTIYLLYGLTRERMMVVAAHEYGHTWLHENVRRKLNNDTVEGFCDWIAFNVIKGKNAPYETKLLLESLYSQGQLQSFILAENEHSFYKVIQWVKSGIDPEIDPEHLEGVLKLRNQPTAPFELFAGAPVFPRATPTNLVLKGLSGSKARRFALINDGTFTQNETGKVRLGDSNVVVRCLQIGTDSALIQIAGETEPRMLKLGQP